MITKKNCGNCTHFLKFKNKSYSLCNFNDTRTTSGSPKCDSWKGIKYKYKENK